VAKEGLGSNQEAKMTTITASTEAVPDHVPAHLVWDWDQGLAAYAQQGDDPYLALARLHAGPDIIWAKNLLFGNPGWIITRHAPLQDAYLDTDHFSSDSQNLAMLGVSWKLNPLEYDPPEHHQYRRILNPFFTPRAISALDETMKGVCDTLIEQFKDRGSCEFIGDFAEAFPSYIFLDLMGMPREMLPSFLEWERDMLRGPDPLKRLAAMQSVLGYLEKFLAEQRQNPGTELLRGILGAQVDDGRALDEGEVMGMCYLLYIGGLDTVYATLGWILRHLAMDHALQNRLRQNPQEVAAAVDEFVRAYAVAAPQRAIKKDLVFHGVQMRAGDTVLFPTYLAARDPRAFENPHVIDIDRRSRHLGFATGPHTCLGMHLAKRELRTVIEYFLSRFRNIRIADGEGYEYHAGGVLGVDRLPLRWD
jgi:cytochrome P450